MSAAIATAGVRMALDVDVPATARFLRLDAPALPPASSLRLPLARLGRPLLNRVVHPAGRFAGYDRVYYLPRVRRALPPGAPAIRVRVDDYPRADLPTERFFEFARVLADHGIQMLLGVTPLLAGRAHAGLTEAEARWLVEADAAGAVRIAMHGTTHENVAAGRGRHATTELCGVGVPRLQGSVRAGLDALARAGVPRPVHYIPPFNTVDAAAWRVLAAHYRYIHGGPLTMNTLGPYAPGCVLDGAVYLPSLRPFYGRAAELIAPVRRHLDGAAGARSHPLVLTLHWAWEISDGMRALRRLAALLAGRAATWQSLERADGDAGTPAAGR